MAEGALLHHGFDGTSFLATDGAGVPPACAPIDEGPWRRAAMEGRPVYASVADLPPRARLAAEVPGFSAIWCTPIEDIDHLPKAVLSVWRREPGPPVLGAVAGLKIQTRYAQLAVQRWAEHQRLIHNAGHDNLTGVANRTNFRDRLASALAIGEENIAVAFCDLDSFKPVNDTYGHRTGDKVLVEVADRLRRSLRSGDELARLGGDEFTVLMRNVPDATAAQHLAERILAATSEPFDADGHPVKIGISVGIALVGQPTSADDILALADAALYAAKGKGGNQAHVTQA
jgi:diguanylate cyclase (GGDEF)-like protein